MKTLWKICFVMRKHLSHNVLFPFVIHLIEHAIVKINNFLRILFCLLSHYYHSDTSSLQHSYVELSKGYFIAYLYCVFKLLRQIFVTRIDSIIPEKLTIYSYEYKDILLNKSNNAVIYKK